MTVSVGFVEDTEYTWQTANMPWNSPIAARPWGGFSSYIYTILSDETIDVSAADLRSLLKALSETLNWSEARNYVGTKPHQHTITVSENYIDLINFIISVTEVVTIAEKAPKSVTKPLAETLSVTEHRLAEFGKNMTELFTMLEEPSREALYHLVFTEVLTFVDSQNKSTRLNISELFEVVEAYVRNANAVLGDIEIKPGGLTFEQFQELMSDYHPPGYTEWNPFVPGDHEFERAVFEIKPERAPSDTNTELRLTNLKINADVPDIADRGGDTIPAGGAWVSFHRVFQNVPNNPEVTVNLKAGSELAIPIIDVIEYDRFYVRMVKVSDGTDVEADITWSAEGF